MPNDFLENNARIPKVILNKNNEHLLAVLIAFILDEGHVDSSCIVIGLNNKKLLLDIKNICDKLNYKNIIRSKGVRNHLYILSEGVKKFWVDYNKLKENYPEVNLDYKEKQIENFILRKNKPLKALQQGETQNKIISLLNESERTVKELAIMLKISRQGTKWHLKQLEKNNVVAKIGKGYANSDIYRLLKYVVLPITKKGRSRQYGISNKKILDILKSSSKTTKEISGLIDINRATTLHFLLNLEKNGLIKKTGKKVHKTTPSIIWSIN